ncbi:MAG: hypothetical protein ACK4NZ_05825 [Tsuneonella sp.]
MVSLAIDRLTLRTSMPALVLVATCSPVAAQTTAQTVEEELSRTAADLNIGKGFQTIAVLGQTPGTSSTTLNGDDAEIRTSKLHAQHRFTRRDFTGRVITSPFLEITLGRAKANQAIVSDASSPSPYRMDLQYRSRSVLINGGAVIPVGADTRVTPMVTFGRSTLRIDGQYSGANADIVNEVFDGLLDDARIKSVFIGPALQIDHKRMVLRDSRLTTVVRYNHVFNLSNSVTDPGLEPRGSAGVGTLYAKIDSPTRIYLGEREVFAGVFARGTVITGAGRKQFGFDNYAELGGTFVLDYPTQRGIGLGVYGSVLKGRGVDGHSLGVTIRFAGMSAGGPS